jgi:MarR family transcriptional regulator, organic hydroperoxide resistance regulator
MEYDRVVAIETKAPSASRKDVARVGTDLGSQAWSLLQRVVFSQRPRWMAVIREYDLVPPHWIALQTLDEPKPMGELARQLACDSSNVTWITDRLEERGLVERQPAEYDRRVKLLVLTPKGRALRSELEERLSEAPPPIASLSQRDQRTLRDLLRRAVENLETDQSSNRA